MGELVPCGVRRISVDSPLTNPFMIDYYRSDHFLNLLYEYNPFVEKSYFERVHYIDKRENPLHREKLVEVLRSYHTPELLHPAVDENLKRLSQSGSMVVIGGQQAGLLTGPLYTISKAIALIQMAKKKEKQLQRPVIPVFWIAGEDHDVDEVDHIWVKDGQMKPQKYRFPVEKRGKYPISSLELTPEQLHSWLDQLRFILPDRIYKQEWLDRWKNLITEPISWSRYFARLLHDLFGKWGLLLIDSADPGLRQLEVPMFEKLFNQAERINQQVMKAAKQLEQRGHVPVEMDERRGNLFIHLDGERCLLYLHNGVWYLKERERSFSLEELLTYLREDPTQFSNNVLTRPLMQEYLFPTLAFVGGPGEVAYWGLLKEAFRVVDLQMPIVYPRPNLTFIDPLVQKRMSQFGLTWLDLFSDLTAEKEKWLQAQSKVDFASLFAGLKKQLADLYQPLVKTLEEEIGMDLPLMAKKNQQRVEEQIDFLERYTDRQLKVKYQTTLRRWDELIDTVSPRGRMQERVYNLLTIWNEHGMSWLDQLLNEEFIDRKNNMQLIIM